jgi:hypothetical protein
MLRVLIPKTKQRNTLGVMDMFIAMIMVIVSYVYA